jgi:excisionase family DNA binding protein
MPDPVAIRAVLDVDAIAPPTHSPGDTSSLMLASEVAELLQVTTGWVYAETRRGGLPHIRLGRYVRYRRSAIQAWLDGREEPAACQR